ncbi:MAG: hypothetical protein RSO15_14880 [Bacteroides sp.]|uniref:hypothetical protein n=1 Tax=Bacteroides sp. TaxID=29523 RepID=UPI002FCA900B
MTHWKTQFNYKWLGAYCLPDGKDIILTIKEMKREEVVGTSGKKELLLVAYFHEAVKPMVVNKTNCKALEKLFKTPIIEDWSGKQMQVGASRVDAFGDKVDALRVRPFLPKVGEDVRPTIETGSAVWNSSIDYLKSGNDLNAIMRKYKLTKEQIKTLQQYEVK